MTKLLTSVFVVPMMFTLACGPADDPEGNGDPNEGEDQICEPTADKELICFDGIDDDCNGKTDCEEIACAFDSYCTGENTGECGEASHGGEPLAIPDGNGTLYETSITIGGFVDGQKLTDASGLVSVCVNMEHTWLRDLEIEFECPSGQTVILHDFRGREGGEIYMGIPNDGDGVDPEPGTGMDYCWTMTAENPNMLDWADANIEDDPFQFPPPPNDNTLPADDYQPFESMDQLIGCDLNGEWRLKVVDDWQIDNGYIFEWSVNFNPDIIEDCSDWID